LCGFIDSSFKHLKPAERKKLVIKQVKNIFGEKATAFLDYEECIWSQEKHTFDLSESALLPHQNNGNPNFNSSLFNGKLLISSSESASSFSGYMEGAVISGNVTAEKSIYRSK
jgi:monoamine oxidase